MTTPYMQPTDAKMTKNEIVQLTKQLAGNQGTKSGKDNLITSAMLDEGDGPPLRVQCVLPPASAGSGTITIRKFSTHQIEPERIPIIHAVSDDPIGQVIEEIKNKWQTDKNIADIAKTIIENHLTVLVSGGTSSGKTTVLKALMTYLPKEERLITIEDVPELLPNMPNYVSLIADREKENRGPKKLLESVLRMRPDRFLVGELRGDETRMFIEAINTGHTGSLSTMHANTAETAINWLVLMGLGGGANVSPRLMVSNICDTIDLVIQCGRVGDKRGVTGLYVPREHSQELRDKF